MDHDGGELSKHASSYNSNERKEAPHIHTQRASVLRSIID
jgi:hypothetical protein